MPLPYTATRLLPSSFSDVTHGAVAVYIRAAGSARNTPSPANRMYRIRFMVRLPRGQEPDRMTGTPSLCPSRPGPVGRARGTWQEGGVASQPAQNASVHRVLSKRRALMIRDGTPRGRGYVPS